MPKIVHVGKSVPYVGKTLWEIVGNLKDFGVGRLIYRHNTLRYPEPSFDKIVKVETLNIKEDPYMQLTPRDVITWVERVFRGKKYPVLIEICQVSSKPDFHLVPKNEEEIWYKRFEECKPNMRIYDPYVEMPPLLNLILKDELKAKGLPVPDVIKVKAWLKLRQCCNYRVAKENEVPTHRLSALDISRAVTPSLYENIEASRPHFENRNSWEDMKNSTYRKLEKLEQS